MNIVKRETASPIRDSLILLRMRAEWYLWLAFTTELNPRGHDRSVFTRSADALLIAEINAARESSP